MQTTQQRCRRSVAAQRPLLPVIGFVLALIGGLYHTVDAQEVFAPFVSRIRVAVRDPEIRITWSDSTDDAARYLLFRATTEITAATLNSATLIGIVEPGVEMFVHVPPTVGNFFFAIIAESGSGRRYDILVPYRNKTVSPVTIATRAAPEALAVNVSAIDVTVEAGDAVVRFTPDRVGRELVVYRRTAPIRSLADLEDALSVARIPSDENSIRDIIVPGIDYYYAVLDTELVTEGTARLVDGQNVSTTPVRIELGPRTLPIAVQQPVGRRAESLPYLILQSNLETGERLALSSVDMERRPTLPPAAQTALDHVLASLAAPPAARPEPYVFEMDRVPSGSAEEQLLQSILHDSFAAGDWPRAVEALSNYLTLPLSGEPAARARFYRGQALFFADDYRNAALDFVLVLDTDYAVIRRWLDSVLAELTES